MLEQFVILMCLSTNYATCQTTSQAYYHSKLEQPLTQYYKRHKIEAVERIAVLAAAAKEQKFPIVMGEKILTFDAKQSSLSLVVPF